MTRLRMRSAFSLAIMGIAAISLLGCAEVLETLNQSVAKPRVELVGTRLADLSLSGVALEFDLRVHNGLSVDVPVLDLAYSVGTGETPFAQGRTDIGGFIPGGGSRDLTLPVALNFAEMLNLISGLRPGQVLPYRAALELSVDPPGIGPLALPMSTEGELPIPTAPSISVADITWDELSLQSVAGTLRLEVGNGNDFPLELGALDYGLELAGRDVAGGNVVEGLALGATDKGQLAIPLAFSPMSAGVALFSALTGGSTEYALTGSFKVNTPFGDMTLPLDSRGTAPLLR